MTPEELEAAANVTKYNTTTAMAGNVSSETSVVVSQANNETVVESKPSYDTNSTEGILSMARNMMSERVKETAEKAKHAQEAIKVEATVVNQDIDAMQKALNDKIATRQRLAREESDSMGSELRAKQNEEKLKFEEANDKIQRAQSDLAKQQGLKKIHMEQEATNAKQTADRLERERTLAIDKQKKLEGERSAAVAEEAQNKKAIAAGAAESEMRNARVTQQNMQADAAAAEAAKANEAKSKAQALDDEQKALKRQAEEAEANKQGLAKAAAADKVLSEAQRNVANVINRL